MHVVHVYIYIMYIAMITSYHIEYLRRLRLDLPLGLRKQVILVTEGLGGNVELQDRRDRTGPDPQLSSRKSIPS